MQEAAQETVNAYGKLEKVQFFKYAFDCPKCGQHHETAEPKVIKLIGGGGYVLVDCKKCGVKVNAGIQRIVLGRKAS